jgi:nucleoside 2-deoxyribosyltransferase
MKKKVYICSSLRPEVHARVTGILQQLPEAIHLRPYIEQIGNKIGHVETDVAMINWADEIWVLNEYGRDCQWEIGYAAGIKKPVIVFRDEFNRDKLEHDWMWNAGVNEGLVKVVELEDVIREEAVRREQAQKEAA